MKIFGVVGYNRRKSAMWDVAQERLFDQHFKQYIYFTIWDTSQKVFRIVTHNAKVAAIFYPHCKNT
jgi:hypothetical protein